MRVASAGWILLGQYPVGDPDGVGSWILHHGNEAALLELPPDPQLMTDAVTQISSMGLRVRHIFVSHDHEDHFDPDILLSLRKHPEFREASWHPPQVKPRYVEPLSLGGEPLWRVHAPKHSQTDVVTIFRGLAMTGDIELGMTRSVNREVSRREQASSLAFLADFEAMHGYRVHDVVSAHLNDLRFNIDWRRVVQGDGE